MGSERHDGIGRQSGPEAIDERRALRRDNPGALVDCVDEQRTISHDNPVKNEQRTPRHDNPDARADSFASFFSSLRHSV